MDFIEKKPILVLVILFILFGLSYSSIKKMAATQKSEVAGKSDSSIGEQGSLSSGPKYNSQPKLIEENTTQNDNLSPFHDKVRLVGISGLYSADSNTQFFTISTILRGNEKVKITGWYIKSEITNYFVTIGQAAILPFPYTQTLSDVFLKSGDKVYLSKGFSPIGIPFRTNKCTGYFTENRQFYPPLFTMCPYASEENLPKFSNDLDSNDECIRTIELIGRCKTVDNAFLRNLPDTINLTCKNYLSQQINYNTCVANHLSDSDFVGNEYRLYSNKLGPLWRTTHDKLKLYDSNGLVVDSISW